ncbi:FAD-dependent oxidoreductase [Accumulibacter sp.]|uniref:FAD-dependent oxidoreductase n=1 Tax=Accumulibacter sp. TaxID=2053492 RepID=UPI0025CC63ED|nr:FAD-dependent oxidoreductase [Accumulibacter sp.]MCM8612998.1 FAD-dependent oxidoreductase [Accumulibacter sp.]MCM8637052.1 FAD-dependent oxidoreductase [Accumulibacter sp.]MCM8640698.1 FAD-dependent oxidoreductase [Accumulibacter sp.]
MPSRESGEPDEILLVGGGHSHVIVLRELGLRPLAGARVTLVSNAARSPYSGMLPGYVAGHYDFAQVHIDLPRLAAFAGAHFVTDEVAGIDRAARLALCRSGRRLPWDLLSINVGATPRIELGATGAAHVVPVKPISGFNERWLALLQRARRLATAGDAAARTLTIAVVGGGAAGVELLLAMQCRLRQEFARLRADPQRLRWHLLTRDPDILPTHSRRVRQHFRRLLAERGVRLHLGAAVDAAGAGWLQWQGPGGAGRLAADEAIWVTRARGATWLRDSGLAVDGDGFLRVGDTLQVAGEAHIFAAGDCASMIHHPREKAGVFAVRMGRPLAENLRRAVAGRALVGYRPQRRWLALISTGDRRAVASRGAFSAAGRWVWHWKDWIDRRFMRRFADLPERRK